MGFDCKCIVAVSRDLGAYRFKVYKDIERFRHRIIGRHEAECLESLNLRIGWWRLVIELRVLAVGHNPTVMSGELYSEGIGGGLQKEREKNSKYGFWDVRSLSSHFSEAPSKGGCRYPETNAGTPGWQAVAINLVGALGGSWGLVTGECDKIRVRGFYFYE